MQSASESRQAPPLRLVLFDLDGTLADTAPDLVWALNQVRNEQHLATLPFDQIRAQVSHGAAALIRLGFDCLPEQPGFEQLHSRLLDIYRKHIAVRTTLFPGMQRVLDEIETNGLSWGVVTNKPAALTDPLMQALGLYERAAAIISGDTTGARKPDPEPLLEACRRCHIAPQQALYVGDALRDIVAGQRAGMHTLAAAFGYVEDDEPIENWQADAIIDRPLCILEWIQNYQEKLSAPVTGH